MVLKIGIYFPKFLLKNKFNKGNLFKKYYLWIEKMEIEPCPNFCRTAP